MHFLIYFRSFVLFFPELFVFLFNGKYILFLPCVLSVESFYHLFGTYQIIFKRCVLGGKLDISVHESSYIHLQFLNPLFLLSNNHSQLASLVLPSFILYLLQESPYPLSVAGLGLPILLL